MKTLPIIMATKRSFQMIIVIIANINNIRRVSYVNIYYTGITKANTNMLRL